MLHYTRRAKERHIKNESRAQLIIDSVKRNVKKYPRVILNIVNSYTRRNIEEFGLSEGVCINGKPVIKEACKMEGNRSRYLRLLLRTFVSTLTFMQSYLTIFSPDSKLMFIKL